MTNLPDNSHIVGGTCSHCQHPNYYDARELCKGQKRYRRVTPAKPDDVAVTCQHCGKEFKIKVDCEAYR